MYAENLEVINVSKSQEGTGMSLQTLKDIRELPIDNCPKITKGTIESFCFYDRQILEVFSVDVRISYILGIICVAFNNNSMLDIWMFCDSLEFISLKNLTAIEFSICGYTANYLNAIDFINVVQSFDNIKKLYSDIDFFSKRNNNIKSAIILENIKRHKYTIQKLVLHKFKSITKQGITEICQLKKLRQFDLTGCKYINHDLTNVINDCGLLAHLDMRQYKMNQITVRAVINALIKKGERETVGYVYDKCDTHLGN
jgi:hypothetical protein